MAGGKRIGAGRGKGSLNKATLAIQELCAKATRSPFETMALIAAGDSIALGLVESQGEGLPPKILPVPLQLQLDAADRLAPYLGPRRKPVDDAELDDLQKQLLRQQIRALEIQNNPAPKEDTAEQSSTVRYPLRASLNEQDHSDAAAALEAHAGK